MHYSQDPSPGQRPEPDGPANTGFWLRWRVVSLALAIVLELVALWRSLQPRDDDEAVYQITLRFFLASIVVLLAGVLLAGLIASHVFSL